MNIETEANILASSNFLNIEFPDNYGDMDREELLQFINENKKYFLEDSHPLAVAELIEALAQDLIRFNRIVEESKLTDVTKEYLDRMVASNLITEEESSEFYEEFLTCKDNEGGEKAFQKLSDHIQKIRES
jgi:rubrerythrin